MSIQYVNRSNDEEIIDIARSIMDNGTGETKNEHILIKLLQIRNTPMLNYKFEQERVDFHYKNWRNLNNETETETEKFNRKKYSLLETETKNFNGRTLKRIIYNDGKTGGWLESYDNLSQDGDCKVLDEAKVYDNAKVYGNVKVYGYAIVYGNAEVYENAKVFGNARVHGNAIVYGNAEVYENAKIFDYARVHGNAKIK